MAGAVDTLRWVSFGLYLLLGAVALRGWIKHRGAPSAWVAGTFCSLAIVLLAGRLLPDDGIPDDLMWLGRILVAALALFPYLLYRFTSSFIPSQRGAEVIATVLTGGLIATSFIVPSFPRPDEPRPAWAIAWLIGFVAQWAVLFGIVARRLWRAGRGQPTLVRRRMRLLSLGAGGLIAAIVISSTQNGTEASVATIVSQIISNIAAIALLIGLAPPRILRNDWRRAEDGATQAMILNLMSAETPQAVADVILPYSVNVIGTNALALVAPGGDVIGCVGVHPEDVAAASEADDQRVVRVEGRYATLLAWTDPYSPFFAPDDIDLLGAIGGMVELVLERCSKLAYERRFIANAAHELRTPLTTLSGLSMTLAARRHQMTNEEIAQCFDALNRQGERTKVLIENLLDLAQIEHGKPDLNPCASPLRSAAARALESAPPPVGKHVRVNIAEAATAVVDQARLEQVLINLLTNAYRYGGDHIALEAFSDVGGALLIISDDGPGVPHELLPQLFEPFGRGSIGSNRGSGLGLAIVRRLVAAHGGDVWYEPGDPHGARFTIRLPSAA